MANLLLQWKVATSQDRWLVQPFQHNFPSYLTLSQPTCQVPANSITLHFQVRLPRYIGGLMVSPISSQAKTGISAIGRPGLTDEFLGLAVSAVDPTSYDRSKVWTPRKKSVDLSAPIDSQTPVRQPPKRAKLSVSVVFSEIWTIQEKSVHPEEMLKSCQFQCCIRMQTVWNDCWHNFQTVSQTSICQLH